MYRDMHSTGYLLDAICIRSQVRGSQSQKSTVVVKHSSCFLRVEHYLETWPAPPI